MLNIKIIKIKYKNENCILTFEFENSIIKREERNVKQRFKIRMLHFI